MKKFFLASILFLFTSALFAQFGFFKNYCGMSGFIFERMNKISDGYILSGSSQSQYYSSLVKIDTNFNFVWKSDFACSQYGDLTWGIELDDHSIASIFFNGGTDYILTKTDSSGVNQFANYYHSSTSSVFSTGVLCKSADNDTGFVTMYSGCALHYGIAKFDKNGNVVWCYEYGANGMNGGVYDLTTGFGRGYITCGSHIFNTNRRSAVVGQFGNDGHEIRTEEFFLDTSNSWFYRPTKAYDSTYYFFGNTYHNYPSITNDPWQYLVNIDTNMNVVKCWKMFPSSNAYYMNAYNMTAANDGTLIINGTFQDSNSQPRVFVLKFNPAGNGSVVWCKTWLSPVPHNWHTSMPVPSVFLKGNANDIVMPLWPSQDGPCIGGMDFSGNGLCGAVDDSMTFIPWPNCTSNAVTLFRQTVALNKYPYTMVSDTVPYSDTLFCAGLASAQENFPEQKKLFFAYNDHGQIMLNSESDSPLDAEIYSLEGKLIAKVKLNALQRETVRVDAEGIYLIRGVSGNNVQTEKIVAGE